MSKPGGVLFFFSFLYFFSSFLQNPFCARAVRTGVCVLKRVFFSFFFEHETSPCCRICCSLVVKHARTHTPLAGGVCCTLPARTHTARAIQRLLSQAVVERDWRSCVVAEGETRKDTQVIFVEQHNNKKGKEREEEEGKTRKPV